MHQHDWHAFGNPTFFESDVEGRGANVLMSGRQLR